MPICGRIVLQASLQKAERTGSFKKDTERLSLNDLAKKKTINDTKILSSFGRHPFDSLKSISLKIRKSPKLTKTS